jgi:ABC-type multidrug transport system fused ATPase/permease subunit
LRQKIGYVGEDPFIFNATIRENMQFAAPKESDENITKVLSDLGCMDFLKNGLDTMVGDPENSFSNGQLQSLAVARAMVSCPRILLLDEATSAMEQKFIDKVFKCIEDYRAAGNLLTVVIVPFRIGSFKRCDCIVVQNKDGSVNKTGTHDSLMSDSTEYSDYCKIQQNSDETQLKVET